VIHKGDRILIVSGSRAKKYNTSVDNLMGNTRLSHLYGRYAKSVICP